MAAGPPGANAQVLVTNLLWWRETAPPWIQKSRFQLVCQFTVASAAVSISACVYFQIVQIHFSFDVIGFRDLAFSFLAFHLASTFLRSGISLETLTTLPT